MYVPSPQPALIRRSTSQSLDQQNRLDLEGEYISKVVLRVVRVMRGWDGWEEEGVAQAEETKIPANPDEQDKIL